MKKLLLTLLCFLLAASYTAFAAGQGGQATADDVLEYRVLMNVSKDRVPSERPSFFDKELEKRFGMRWNVEELATDSLPDTLELYWASGEDVDYFGGWAKDKVNKWGAEGFIHPAEDLLDRLPNYRKLWTDEEWAQNVMLNSGFNNVLYFLPAKGGRVIDNDGNEYDRLVTSEGWYYKKSAFDKIGLEFPETTEGLRETLRTLKKEFPDEFMGLTIRGSSDHIWTVAWIFTPAFRTYRYFLVDPDGPSNIQTYGPTTEKWRDMVIYINSLYEEGLLDPEWATMDKNGWVARFANGNAFIGAGWATRAIWGEDLEKQTNPDVEWAAYPKQLIHYEDKPRITNYGSPVSGGGPCFPSSLEGEKLDRMLEYADFASTREGALFNYLGIEGTHYKLLDNGRPELLPHMYSSDNTEGRQLWEDGIGAGSIGVHMRSLDTYTDTRSAQISLACTQAALEPGVQAYKKDEHNHFIMKYTADEAKKQEELYQLCRDTMVAWTTKFILGQEDPNDDAAWDKFQAELKKSGVVELTALRNEVFQRFPDNFKRYLE